METSLPALLPFTDGIILHFLQYDHVSLTHLTAQVSISQEWSWWGAIKSYVMPTTFHYSGINEIFHVMPSITEFVLSEW